MCFSLSYVYSMSRLEETIPHCHFYPQRNNAPLSVFISHLQSPRCAQPGHLWTPRHKNMHSGWQKENWFFTSEVRGLYPNRLAEYTNIPMLSSVVLLSATMRIGLTPLHPMSQTHGIDGQREGNRRKEGTGSEWCAAHANAHYSNA